MTQLPEKSFPSSCPRKNPLFKGEKAFNYREEKMHSAQEMGLN